MTKMKYPVIEVDFGKPIHGYWDGGAKQRVTFSPRHKTHTGGKIEWGSWSANFYFTAKGGRTWVEAAAIAKRMLAHMLRKQTGATITISWESLD